MQHELENLTNPFEDIIFKLKKDSLITVIDLYEKK